MQNKATGEVGIIKVQRLERHKNGSRIHFLCGRPALRWISTLYSQSQRLMEAFHCGETEFSERALRQKEEVQQLKGQRQELLNRLSAREAAELLRNAPSFGKMKLVKHILIGTTQEEMKQLFTLLTEQKGVAVLLGGEADAGAFLIFGCHKGEKRVDVRPAFKEAVSLISGKGGGGACYAQGLGSGIKQLEKAVETAGKIMEQQLELSKANGLPASST